MTNAVVNATLEQWKSRLLDLSRRNHLLYFKPVKRGSVKIEGPGMTTLFDMLVKNGGKLTFLQDAADEAAPSSAANNRTEEQEFTNEQNTVEPQSELTCGSEDFGQGIMRQSTVDSSEIAQETGGIGDSVETGPASGNATYCSPGLVSPQLSQTNRLDGAPEPCRDKVKSTDKLWTHLSDQQLSATLYNIRSRSRRALEEQGANVLHLSFGMLTWFDTKQGREEIHSPLILVPVELARSSFGKPYTLEWLEEDILLNPTLLHKLHNDFNLSLPALPEDLAQFELEDFFGQIRDAIPSRRGWLVSPEVHLGLFAFEKLVMLNDLACHAQAAREHPLVAALAGDRSKMPEKPPDTPMASELDERVCPEDIFQILDADSSQQEAIELAKRGVSFVIQGPPGTGKSQTIANIIAERLAQGKKILFVSEKMAALEVVHKRLAANGLAAFCLEAHSQKANKSAIVAQLGESLDTALAVGKDGDQTALRKLAASRTQLNRYAVALHTEHTPLRWTPFEIHGELAALEQAPSLSFPLVNVLQIDSARFDRMRAALDGLVESQMWESRESHPWHGTLIQHFTFQKQADIGLRFGEFVTCLSEIETLVGPLAETLGVQRPQHLAEVESFARLAALAVETPFIPPQWLSSGRLELLKRAAEEAQTVQMEYWTSRNELLANHTDEILDWPDLPQLVERFETMYRPLLRAVSSGYHRDLKIIQATVVSKSRIDHHQALKSLRLAFRAHQSREWFVAHSAQLQDLFGTTYDGVNARWDEVVSALDWAERFLSLWGEAPVPAEMLDFVCRKSEKIERACDSLVQLQKLVRRARQELAFWATIFPIEESRIDGATITQVPLTQLGSHLQLLLDHLNDLNTWVNFAARWHECEEQGLGYFLETAAAAKLKSDQLIPTFLKRLYRMWLDAVSEQDPALRDFDGEQHNRLVERFRQLDLDQLTRARERLLVRLVALRPQTSWVEAPSTELMLLRHELGKKRRHKPIRKLFAEIPNLLLTLKPCLMMSPLSVSQFLSATEFEFDTVIFDEASQICPEDAVGSILRGSQLIVVGDRNQLPPTSFFRSLGIEPEDWNEEESTEVLESVLDECTVFLPSKMLQWHYRSRHESLIAFSNHYLYGGRLLTFPNADLAGPTFGIEFIHVPGGIYERGKTRANRVEAARVAELVFEHFTKYREWSLGVVAFNEPQREAIDEELQHFAHENAEFEMFLSQRGLDSFFVKNLENVQGDERDVIFFSVGYGRDSTGKLTMNFGPLNGEDGARRLNVAITRARDHVKLISSILPEDLDRGYPNRGVQLLRHYMEYARQGGKPEALDQERNLLRSGQSESLFESVVCQALMERGLKVQRHVGCSAYPVDLAVLDSEPPYRYLLGIECDGTTYHAGKTARDRDRLRHQILQKSGWHIHRVWSRDWIVNPTEQIRSILNAVLDAQAQYASRIPPRLPRQNVVSVGDPES